MATADMVDLPPDDAGLEFQDLFSTRMENPLMAEPVGPTHLALPDADDCPEEMVAFTGEGSCFDCSGKLLDLCFFRPM